MFPLLREAAPSGGQPPPSGQRNKLPLFPSLNPPANNQPACGGLRPSGCGVTIGTIWPESRYALRPKTGSPTPLMLTPCHRVLPNSQSRKRCAGLSANTAYLPKLFGSPAYRFPVLLTSATGCAAFSEPVTHQFAFGNSDVILGGNPPRVDQRDFIVQDLKENDQIVAWDRGELPWEKPAVKGRRRFN